MKSTRQSAQHSELHLTSFLPGRAQTSPFKGSPGPSRTYWAVLLWYCFSLFKSQQITLGSSKEQSILVKKLTQSHWTCSADQLRAAVLDPGCSSDSGGIKENRCLPQLGKVGTWGWDYQASFTCQRVFKNRVRGKLEWNLWAQSDRFTFQLSCS